MNTKHGLLLILGLILSTALLMGCGDEGTISDEEPTSTLEPTPTARQISAEPTSMLPPESSPTPQPQPTSTLRIAVESPVPAPEASDCLNDLSFITDVTIPDDTVMTPGESFVKTWRVQNSGTCPWSTSYQLVFIREEQMGATPVVALSQEVALGGLVDLSVNLTAPTIPGTYRSIWQLRAPDGALFGPIVFTQIVVVEQPAPATSTPVPTEEPAALASLKDELFLPPIGGGGGGPPPCFDQTPPSSPTIETAKHTGICIGGFPFDEVITVELYASSGDSYSAVYQIEWEGEEAKLVRTSPSMAADESKVSHVQQNPDGITAIRIDLWFPAGLPRGEWHVVAHSASAFAEGSLFVATTGPQEINIMPNFEVNPFQLFLSRLTFSAGEQVEIGGINYPPNRELPLGIYHSDGDFKIFIILQTLVTTDSQGQFRTTARVEPSDPAGQYVIIAVTDAESEYVESKHGDGYEFNGEKAYFNVE